MAASCFNEPTRIDYCVWTGRITDRHLLFAPRHDFFSLDAGALNTGGAIRPAGVTNTYRERCPNLEGVGEASREHVVQPGVDRKSL